MLELEIGDEVGTGYGGHEANICRRKRAEIGDGDRAIWGCQAWLLVSTFLVLTRMYKSLGASQMSLHRLQRNTEPSPSILFLYVLVSAQSTR